MMNKNSRLELIKMILNSQEIASQEALLREMSKAGVKMTQATLSRDLKQLKVIKNITPSGKYAYILPSNQAYRRVSDNHLTMAASNRAGLLSVNFSGNILVVHTLPGHASHIAYDIDNANIEEFIGTIAGDDTIFLVLAEHVERAEAIRRLAEVVPNIK